MVTLELFLPGTLDICFGGLSLPQPPTRESPSLLAYPLLRHRHLPLWDRLAGLFWRDRPQEKACHSPVTALWRVCRCFPDKSYVPSDVYSVQFDPQMNLWLDVDEFESIASHKDMVHLQSTATLLRDQFLEGFYPTI